MLVLNRSFNADWKRFASEFGELRTPDRLTNSCVSGDMAF